jgi:hypothetical protein
MFLKDGAAIGLDLAERDGFKFTRTFEAERESADAAEEI